MFWAFITKIWKIEPITIKYTLLQIFEGFFSNVCKVHDFVSKKHKNLLTNVSRRKYFCCVLFGSFLLPIATKNVCKMAVLQTKKVVF